MSFQFLNQLKIIMFFGQNLRLHQGTRLAQMVCSCAIVYQTNKLEQCRFSNAHAVLHAVVQILLIPFPLEQRVNTLTIENHAINP